MASMDFDKPIQELEGKISELRNMTGSKDFNIAEEITRLESKAEKLMRVTYSKLSPVQKVQVARHPERPHFSDYIANLIQDFTPLAGDRQLIRFDGHEGALPTICFGPPQWQLLSEADIHLVRYK